MVCRRSYQLLCVVLVEVSGIPCMQWVKTQHSNAESLLIKQCELRHRALLVVPRAGPLSNDVAQTLTTAIPQIPAYPLPRRAAPPAA